MDQPVDKSACRHLERSPASPNPNPTEDHTNYSRIAKTGNKTESLVAEELSDVTQIKMALSNDADKAMIFVHAGDPCEPTRQFVRSQACRVSSEIYLHCHTVTHVHSYPCVAHSEDPCSRHSAGGHGNNCSHQMHFLFLRQARMVPLIPLRRPQRKTLLPAPCWRPRKLLLS